MFKIRYCSDLHLDFDVRMLNKHMHDHMIFDNIWTPVPMPDDKETCLVIAGDIWYNSKFFQYQSKSWMHKVAQQFKYVVFVLGNHDYWDSELNVEPNKIRQHIAWQELKNVFFLENDCVILDGIKFVGGTLWTDYGKHMDLHDHAVSMSLAVTRMMDYRNTRVLHRSEYIKATPRHMLDVFNRTKETIFSHGKDDCDKLIVVTHMAPSIKSVNAYYKEYTIDNTWYYSDLEKEIEASEIDYWFHGHMHDPCRYMIGNTEVIANPRGYIGQEKLGFNEYAHIEV